MIDADTYLAQFQHRLLQDALAEASADYWRRRANDLLAARPDPANDFIPAECLEEARIRWRELTDAAAACRAKADVMSRMIA